jgi:hypothetical protein
VQDHVNFQNWLNVGSGTGQECARPGHCRGDQTVVSVDHGVPRWAVELGIAARGRANVSDGDRLAQAVRPSKFNERFVG